MDRKSVVAMVISIVLLAGSGTAFARDRSDDRRHDRDAKKHVTLSSSQIRVLFPGVFVKLNLSNDHRGFVWVPGYWHYRGPYYGYVWVPGHWEKSAAYCRIPVQSPRRYADRRHHR